MEEKKINPMPLELNDQELNGVSGGLTAESINSMSLTDDPNLQKPAKLLNHALPYGLVYEQMASDDSRKP